MQRIICKTLQENKKLKDLFSTEKLVEAMTKVVSAMTMQGSTKTSKGTQYQGASNYIVREQQPQLAHGANGYCNLVSPASIVRTLDILRTTVSG